MLQYHLGGFVKHIFLLKEDTSSDFRLEIERLATYYRMNYAIEIANMDKMKDIIHYYKDKNVVLYAVGGDGTLNFVLNEMIGGNATLGLIPTGTGNDFYRKVLEYPDTILDVNVMSVNNRYGLNIFSVGIDAEICANAQKFKKFGPALAYNLSIFYTFFKYKCKNITVNDEKLEITLLSICNGSYYGRGFAISPNSDILSKNVFVYFVSEMQKLEMPSFLLDLLRTEHFYNPYVNVGFSERPIHIHSSSPLYGQLDGEEMLDTDYIVDPKSTSVSFLNNKRFVRELIKK